MKVRLSCLIPFVLAVSMMGAFAITGSMVGPLTVAGAGALGWTMRRYGYPVTAIVMGLLIGPMAEGELTRSWQISGGDPAFLLERPITLVMLGLLNLMLGVVLFGRKVHADDSKLSVSCTGADAVAPPPDVTFVTRWVMFDPTSAIDIGATGSWLLKEPCSNF